MKQSKKTDDEEYLVLDAEKLKESSFSINILLNGLEGKPWCLHTEKSLAIEMKAFNRSKPTAYTAQNLPAPIREQMERCLAKTCTCAKGELELDSTFIDELLGGLKNP